MELWHALLSAAKDADAECLSEWIRNGFPLGIRCDIHNSGIFPATDEVSAAIEASRVQGRLIEDSDGSDVREGRSEVFETWEAVKSRFGQEAKLTKLACIVKVKESGETKYRLVVDSRRSGVNGLMTVKERVILPKITDVVSGLHAIARKCEGFSGFELEMFSVDCKDAFHMCHLREEERQFVICKDSYGCYPVSKVVQFGLAPGPLLWARLASASMRLGQSIVQDWEASVHTYVDDPLILIAGHTGVGRCRVFLLYIALWLALGLQISWKKADKGRCIHWIGFELQLHGESNVDLTVT